MHCRSLTGMPKGGTKAVNNKHFSALIGADFPRDAYGELFSLDCITNVYVLPPDPSVNSSIKTHPDTVLCVFRGVIYCHESYAAIAADTLCEIAEECGLTLCPCGGRRSGIYPFDTAFNALCDPKERFIIARESSICEPLKPLCRNTRQGYAACCAQIINDTVVTADPAIEKTALRLGLAAKRISGGGILLKGYEKGFIGGCTGIVRGDITDTVLTVGDPNSCEAGRELAALCKKMNVPVIPLGSGPLTDVGGIKLIPVKQRP